MYENLALVLQLLLNHAIELVAAIVLVMARPLVVRAADWLQLRADSEVRAYLMTGLDRAVEYGRAEARRRLLAPGSGVVREEVPALQLALAREYVAERFPDALKRFGMDLMDVEKAIRARQPAPPIGTAH